MSDKITNELKNIPKKIVTRSQYYSDYPFNQWVEHTIVFPEMTQIENAVIGVIGSSSASAPHEAHITSINGNIVYFIGKGMWSGGISGFTVTITAFGT